MEKQISAVEWLANEFQEDLKDFGGLHTDFIERFEQAKELFEKQIKNSYKSGVIDGFNSRTVETKTDPQDYFNQIFGKK